MRQYLGHLAFYGSGGGSRTTFQTFLGLYGGAIGRIGAAMDAYDNGGGREHSKRLELFGDDGGFRYQAFYILCQKRRRHQNARLIKVSHYSPVADPLL